jgi:hypothetical protein
MVRIQKDPLTSTLPGFFIDRLFHFLARPIGRCNCIRYSAARIGTFQRSLTGAGSLRNGGQPFSLPLGAS